MFTINTVTTAVKATLTRLLPRRIVESSRSGCLIMSDTLAAPGTPELTRWVILFLCRERNAASELEKKAEKPEGPTSGSGLSRACAYLRRPAAGRVP